MDKQAEKEAAKSNETEVTAEERARDQYFQVLKSSWRIFTHIEQLRGDHPMLNRPFMFDGKNLQSELVRDVLKLRKMMIDVFPSIKR